jgi:hypothetical protein
VKRTPLRRRTPLRSRGALRRARCDRGDTAVPRTEFGGRLNGPVGAHGDRPPPRWSKYRNRPRHTDYMLWVKRQPCLMRGIWGTCEGRVEADHAGPRGVGRKAHDSTCIPLCKRHHQASRFPRAWGQAQRRAWLHAAVIYTQACARAAGVAVPVDLAATASYPATALDRAEARLAAASVHGGGPEVWKHLAATLRPGRGAVPT